MVIFTCLEGMRLYWVMLDWVMLGWVMLDWVISDYGPPGLEQIKTGQFMCKVRLCRSC